jgi:hypothetical protein
VGVWREKQARGRRGPPRQCLFLGRAEGETATAGREDNDPHKGEEEKNYVSSLRSVRRRKPFGSGHHNAINRTRPIPVPFAQHRY